MGSLGLAEQGGFEGKGWFRSTVSGFKALLRKTKLSKIHSSIPSMRRKDVFQLWKEKFLLQRLFFAYAIFIFQHLIHVTKSIKEFFFLVFFL